MCFSLSRMYQNNQFRIAEHACRSSRMYTFQQLRKTQSIAQNSANNQRWTKTDKQEWWSCRSNLISTHGLLAVLANSKTAFQVNMKCKETFYRGSEQLPFPKHFIEKEITEYKTFKFIKITQCCPFKLFPLTTEVAVAFVHPAPSTHMYSWWYIPRMAQLFCGCYLSALVLKNLEYQWLTNVLWYFTSLYGSHLWQDQNDINCHKAKQCNHTNDHKSR